MDSFVDDANLSVNEEGVRGFNARTGKKLNLEQASARAYQGYERYLFLSGGKLALHKCKFYWITFLRKQIKYVFSLRAPKKFMFSKGFTKKRVRLRQLKPNEPHEILGMWTAPDGNQK